jgi:hypothetical protein
MAHEVDHHYTGNAAENSSMPICKDKFLLNAFLLMLYRSKSTNFAQKKRTGMQRSSRDYQ